MNLKEKLTLVEKSIKSISEHRDEDAAVRNAALDKIAEIIEIERSGIATEVQARVKLMTAEG